MKNRKILFRIAVIVITAAIGQAAFAQTASDFEVALTKDGNGVIIKNYTGKVISAIKIPETIEGLPVREIGREAFSKVGSGKGYTIQGVVLKVTGVGSPFTVVLPQGLTKIGENAFSESALTSVVIPDSVTEIGADAFADCNYFVKTGTLNLVFGGGDASSSKSLASVTLPKGLTTVGKGVFRDNSVLKTVVIPNGVPVIGERMFSGCSALKEITIPDSVTYIGANAFEKTGLTSITFGKGITSIGNKAFSGTDLKTLVIPEWVTEIGVESFSGCKSLNSVTLPSTIITIGESAFSSCYALTAVTIPDTVESIQLGGTNSSSGTLQGRVFRGCEKLNLTTQARLKKITLTTAYEKEQEQKKREREEQEAQAQREREERDAQAKREREEQARNRKLIQSYIEDYVSSIDSVLTQILAVKEKEKKAYEKYEKSIKKDPKRDFFTYVSLFKENLPMIKARLLNSELARSGFSGEGDPMYFFCYILQETQIRETPLVLPRHYENLIIGKADIRSVFDTFMEIKKEFNFKTEITLPEFLGKIEFFSYLYLNNH